LVAFAKLLLVLLLVLTAAVASAVLPMRAQLTRRDVLLMRTVETVVLNCPTTGMKPNVHRDALEGQQEPAQAGP